MNKKHRFSLTICQKGTGLALFSLPQTNQYQEINNLNYTEPFKTFNDVGGNRVIVVQDKTEIRFWHHPLSLAAPVNKNWTLSDYKSCNIGCDRIIDGNDPRIKKMAKDVVGKERCLAEVLAKLYYFSLEYLSYGKPTDGLYTYKQAMEERTTDCGGFSTFLMSLLQSVGIPTRLVSGFLIKDNWKDKLLSILNFQLSTFNSLSIHAWFEAQLPDKSWTPLDPSIEWRRRKSLTAHQGGFGFIPADRFVVSFGHNFNLIINKKKYRLDILQLPFYI